MYLTDALKAGETMAKCGVWTYDNNNKYRGRSKHITITFNIK